MMCRFRAIRSAWARHSRGMAMALDTSASGMWTGMGAATTSHRSGGWDFDYFKALECSHDYNASAYYEGDDDRMRLWDGYDVFAQTEDAQRYIQKNARGDPFALVLSWGSAAQSLRNRAAAIPRHVRRRRHQAARQCDERHGGRRARVAGWILRALQRHRTIASAKSCRPYDDCGIRDDTVLVFASDHGDMLGSQGTVRKQKPWDESIRVPFLLRYPAKYGRAARKTKAFLNAHDILPTLLGVCGLPVPDHGRRTRHVAGAGGRGGR